MMAAPSPASRSAWLRPCPRATPVMKATLPSNLLTAPPRVRIENRLDTWVRDHSRTCRAPCHCDSPPSPPTVPDRDNLTTATGRWRSEAQVDPTPRIHLDLAVEGGSADLQKARGLRPVAARLDQ